ncbi:MAG TPA: MGMT family protein [Thermomicrobiales bacterium]|nr:MGMT family protein [Thermomicrobiales bacterium]
MAISKEDAALLGARVYALVRACPAGRATSYGALGAVVGHPRGARMVGWFMNATPDRLEVPAHRVVSKDGTLSGGWAFGGKERMRALLEAEGVTFDARGRVNMRAHGWDPGADLAADERARVLDGASAGDFDPPPDLLRLLNRDPASPFHEPEAGA